MTNGMIDDADFAIERVSFKDSTYEYRGAMRRLGVRVDDARARGAGPPPPPPSVPSSPAARRGERS